MIGKTLIALDDAWLRAGDAVVLWLWNELGVRRIFAIRLALLAAMVCEVAARDWIVVAAVGLTVLIEEGAAARSTHAYEAARAVTRTFAVLRAGRALMALALVVGIAATLVAHRPATFFAALAINQFFAWALTPQGPRRPRRRESLSLRTAAVRAH